MDVIRGGGTWRTHRSRWLPLVAAALCVGLVGTPRPGAASDVTPVTVSIPTGPAPIAPTDAVLPFVALGCAVAPPVPDGYVEQEYFFSGTGSIYEYTPTGIQLVSPCPAAATLGCTIPYTTRMLVLRPIKPNKFSGTVVIEPLNPSASFDTAAIWDRSTDY